MPNNKHIAIIGGDERYIEVIHTLAKTGATIHIVGYTEITFTHSNIHQQDINSLDFTTLDVIILPVGGTGNEGDIKLNFPVQETVLTYENIEQTPQDCTIFTGIANPYLEKLTTHYNRKMITLFSRDDIAIHNSIPTAEATLQIAMESTDYTMHGANILITGFGRVGITTARLFHNIGAHVTVSARNAADFARIKEMRMHPIHHNDLTQTSQIDIFINTVPHLLLTEKVIDQMKQNALIIDLASIPGGTDFKAAEEKGITAIHALALPGNSAPKTAGKVLAETILMLLSDFDQ